MTYRLDKSADDATPVLVGSDVELGNWISGAHPADDAFSCDVAARSVLRQVQGFRDRRSTATESSPLEWGRTWTSGAACLYIDMDHLEVATPICRSAAEHVTSHHALLRVAQEAADRATHQLPPGHQINLHANNTMDGRTAYGSHANYLISRRCWDDIFLRYPHTMLAWLASLQVSSILYTGAGLVTPPEDGRPGQFILCQRAAVMCQIQSLQTTVHRGIVNSRNEPLTGTPFARLHVIFFDSLLMEYGLALRTYVMQIALAMLQRGCRFEPTVIFEDPLRALHDFNGDTTLTATAQLLDGNHCTALRHQRLLLADAERFCADGGCDGLVPDWQCGLHMWKETLDLLDRRDWTALARRIDWVLKLMLVRHSLSERGADMQHPDAQVLDRMYSHLDEQRGLYWACRHNGLLQRVCDDDAIRRRMLVPPSDTRAYLRGAMVWLQSALEASGVTLHQLDWDRIDLLVTNRRDGSVRRWRIDMPDPTRLGEQEVEPLLRDGHRQLRWLRTLGKPLPQQRWHDTWSSNNDFIWGAGISRIDPAG